MSRNGDLIVQAAAALLGTEVSSRHNFVKLLSSRAISSLSADRQHLALAWQQSFVIVDLPSTTVPAASVSRTALELAADETASCLCWVAFRAQNEAAKPFQNLLLLGTSLGFLHLHKSSGELLHRERLHSSACCSIKARNERTASSTAEDVTVCFLDALVLIPGIEIQSLHYRATHTAPELDNPIISAARWELPKSVGLDLKLKIGLRGQSGNCFGAGPRSAGICLGSKISSLYDSMSGRKQSPKLQFLTIGRSPTVANFEAPEGGSEGMLALVSELAGGVAAFAKTLAKSRANGLRAGLGSWLSRSNSKLSTEDSKQKKPPFPPAQAASMSSSFVDEHRIATAIEVAPRGALAAVRDSLGRVLLLDTSTATVIRLWKAYRHVQIAWMKDAGSSSASEEAPGDLMLVLYSPKRAVLELWHLSLGERIVSHPCSRHGLLLQPGVAFGASDSPKDPIFLDCENGQILAVAELLDSTREHIGS